MTKQRIFIAAIFCLLFGTAIAQVPKKKTVLLNNVNLVASGGFEVDSAYLSFEDGTPVPQNNITEVNKKIILWVIISKGWTLTDGKAKVGASEIISTNTGAVVLQNNDLFPAGRDEGSEEDVRYISLKAVITSMTKKIPYFVVKYKIWDKNGKGKISGSYKFYVKK